eukprot:scaffold55914_cov15-Tisochrysis_lutea.AAC.2
MQGTPTIKLVAISSHQEQNRMSNLPGVRAPIAMLMVTMPCRTESSIIAWRACAERSERWSSVSEQWRRRRVR